MQRGAGGELSGDLLRTRDRFEAWRAGRVPGDRIPARLWKQAVRLLVPR